MHPTLQGGGYRVIGGERPVGRAEADIGKGFTAVALLAPFDAGKAVVVSRAYILAIAAAESTFDLLDRTRTLRQWGVGAKRRVGVLACRADTEEWDVASVAALLDKAAAAGLAGIAVTGTPQALAHFEGAGAIAGRLGLFLATRLETRGEQP